MRPDDPLTLFPETAIPVARLARAGLQTSRSRRVDLRVPNRGIRARRDEPPTPRDLAVANAQGDRSLIVSHESAAQVWGMWLPEGRRVRPHLSRRAGRGAPRITGVVGHRLRIGDRRLVETGPADGRFWVTNPAWTWTDLPSCGLRLEALIEAGDSLLQRSDGAPRPPLAFGANPLATVEELRAVVDERSNVAGVPLLREALEHLRPRSDRGPVRGSAPLLEPGAGAPGHAPRRTTAGRRLGGAARRQGRVHSAGVGAVRATAAQSAGPAGVNRGQVLPAERRPRSRRGGTRAQIIHASAPGAGTAVHAMGGPAEGRVGMGRRSELSGPRRLRPVAAATAGRSSARAGRPARAPCAGSGPCR